MKRTPLKKKSDKPRKSQGLFPKKETRNEEWFRIKTEILIPYFISIGLINTCELKLEGCKGNIFTMHFAHSKKREKIAKQEPERTRELCEVVRSCPACHHTVEYLPAKNGVSGEQQMYDIILAVIARRNARLARWKKVT